MFFKRNINVNVNLITVDWLEAAHVYEQFLNIPLLRVIMVLTTRICTHTTSFHIPSHRPEKQWTALNRIYGYQNQTTSNKTEVIKTRHTQVRFDTLIEANYTNSSKIVKNCYATTSSAQIHCTLHVTRPSRDVPSGEGDMYRPIASRKTQTDYHITELSSMQILSIAIN